ncbi:MAG: autotransporter-associated beta strand repeat-containing protein, partial [Zoogloeaceae bacterium]|nr:autotransporter-associated beta strand repeat-containing protein [Zoogloeaceae bacterium]
MALLVPPVAGAEEVYYGGATPDASLLRNTPSWFSGTNSLFPGSLPSPGYFGNTVTINYTTDVSITNPRYVFGGLVENGTAQNNSVFLQNGKVENNLYGGYARSTSVAAVTATDNTVTISGGMVGSNSVYGGFAWSSPGDATATHNTVTISDGEVDWWVYGGYAYSSSSTATATDNIVNISGGKVSGNVFGGFAVSNSGNADATHNTVTISGSPTITGNLYGGSATTTTGTAYAFTDNTLNLKTSDPLTVLGLHNFQYLNFTLPGNINTTTPMLKITGTGGLNYGGTGIELDIRTPAATLADGDYILLRTEDDTQALTDIDAYSLYGEAFTGSGADRTLSLTTGRVRGDFTVKLGGSGKDLLLNISSYNAPNATLTWQGTVSDNRWTNYSTDIYKSPANWVGLDPIGGGSTSLQYLDGDTVRFDDSAHRFDVTIAPEGVAPASVSFDNSASHDYILTGGPITGTGSLTKTGAGKLTLANDNTYTGATTVSTGILNLTGSLQSDVTVQNGATLALSGTVGNSKNVIIASGGTLNAYQGGNIAGDLTANGAMLNFYLPQGIDHDETLLTVGGTATVDNSTIKLLLDGSFNLSQLTP